MNLIEMLLMFSVFSIIGILLGLIIRLIREDIPFKYFFASLQVSILVLIIVPFIGFPFLLMKQKYKKLFIDGLVKLKYESKDNI